MVASPITHFPSCIYSIGEAPRSTPISVTNLFVAIGMATTSIMAFTGSRRKRDPYTRVACTSCKKRKIKCSGDKPCAVCSATESECVYERMKRFRQSEAPDKRPVMDTTRSPSKPQQPSHQITANASNSVSSQSPEQTSGMLVKPGVSNFFFNLAEELHTNTAPRRAPPASPARSKTPLDFAKILRQFSSQSHPNSSSSSSMVLLLGYSTCMSLVDVYEDEIGLLYPFLELDILRDDITTACEAEGDTNHPRNVRLDQVMTMLLGIMSVLQNPDINDLADSFTKATRSEASDNTYLEIVDERAIQLLILTSIYYFMADREVIAWRTIGSVLRILQELGYQNMTSLQQRFKTSHDRARARRILWSAYTLDRRWSFGTGLPFAILESDIDYDVDPLDESLSSSYLRSMVSYCRIATECRFSILGQHADKAPSGMESDFTDFRVLEWRRRLPHALQFDIDHAQFDSTTESRSQYRMRLMLYLRANQMRIVVRRQCAFHSNQANMDDGHIQTMVDVACDTIRVLTDVVNTCDVYHTQQRTFNHFLESAISSLLLVVARRKDLAESSCVIGLHMALDLVRGFAPKSSMMRKLCDRLESLKIVQVILKSNPPQIITTQKPVTIDKTPENMFGVVGSGNTQFTPASRRHSFHSVPAGPTTYLSQNVSDPGTMNMNSFTFLSHEAAVRSIPMEGGDAEISADCVIDKDGSSDWITCDTQGPVMTADSPSMTGIEQAGGMETAETQFIDLNSFPYTYLADLQDILGAQGGTFTF